MYFIWDDWNREHATRHGVTQAEAEFVVRNVRSPYPEDTGDDKQRVCGATGSGRLTQVIFAYKSPGDMDYEQMSYDDIVAMENDLAPYIYVIHARELTKSEKRAFRRRTR